jgi:hypothetical protein
MPQRLGLERREGRDRFVRYRLSSLVGRQKRQPAPPGLFFYRNPTAPFGAEILSGPSGPTMLWRCQGKKRRMLDQESFGLPPFKK